MPRNSAGVYSLPAGNPVVTGTTISSVWANTTLSDLGTAITGSLSRAGEGGMLAPLQLDAGAIGAPGLTWGAETTSGLYRAAAGDFRYSIAGADVFGLTANGAQVANGAVGTPSLSFLSDPDSGIYRIGANNVGISLGGTLRLNIGGAGILLQVSPPSTSLAAVFNGGDFAYGNIESSDSSRTNRYTFGRDNAVTGNFVFGFNGSPVLSMTSGGLLLALNGSAGAPAYSFVNDPDSGVYLVSAGNVGISANGSQVVRFQSDLNTVFSGVGYFPSGSAATPTISFGGDSNTGIYNAAADNLAFAVGGALSFNITSTGLNLSLGQYLVGDGVAGAPSYSFVNDLDTGMYLIGANRIGFATGGTVKVSLDANGLDLNPGGIPLLAWAGAAGTPGYSFAADTDTGIYNVSANAIGISTGGSLRAYFGTGGFLLQSGYIIYNSDGSAAAPAYSFDVDPNTGMYRSGTDTIGFAAGGVVKFYVDPNGANLIDGSAATPSLTFLNDPDTGIYSFGANALGIATGGAARIAISSGFFNFSGSAQAVGGDGTASAPTYSFANDQNSGFYSLSADHIGIATAGATLGALAGGSFTGTLTGMSGATTGTVNWFRWGNLVVLYGSAFSGTSNTTAMTMTGLPAAIQTGSVSRGLPCSLVDNGATQLGMMTVSGGTVTYGTGVTGNTSGFTNSGTKGFGQGIYAVYFLAGS